MKPKRKEPRFTLSNPCEHQGELPLRLEAYKEHEFDRIHFARETIRKGMLAYSKHLAEWLSKPPEERTTSFKPVYEEVLHCLSRALFDATKPWLEMKHRDLDLYIWPGLESQFLREANSRFTPMWDNSPDGAIPCGIGHHFQGDAVISYREADTALWFFRALGQHLEDHLDGQHFFMPGGTHGWATHGDVATQHSTEKDESKLNWLVIAVSEGDKYEFDVRRGVIKIGLKLSDCRNWGPTIAGFLNDRKEVRSEGRWPWLPPTNTSREGALCGHLQEVREVLYNIWLAACFDPDWLATQHTWVEEFADSLRRSIASRPFTLPKLATRISQISNSRSFGHAYKYWYTLALPGIVNPAKPDEEQSLGSLMILSSHELDPDYLYVASCAIDRCYTLLRLYEEAVLREYHTGLREQLRRFAHRNLETIEAVRFHLAQPSVAPHIDPATHGLLATLTATVAIHRQIKHDFTRLFPGVPTNPVDFYVSLAANIAWHRALRAESTSPCRSEAQRLRNQQDPGALLVSDVGLGLHYDPAILMRFTIASESFGVIFVHCLAQALYHAFYHRAKNSSECERMVTVTFDAQETSLQVTIDNRGDSPLHSAEKSKDIDELQELAQFYLASTTGPTWSERSGCWRTELSIILV